MPRTPTRRCRAAGIFVRRCVDGQPSGGSAATPTTSRRCCGAPAPSASSSAGAVVNGVLDAAEALDGDERALALDAGLAWSRAEVRRRALEVLVDAGRGEEAPDLAARDPAKQVRRWAAKLEASLAARSDAPPACSPQGGDRPDEADDREPAQGSLFP